MPTYHWISANFFKGLSIGSALLLLFAVGLVAGYFQWVPAKVVGFTVEVARDLKRNAGAYFSDVPVQHLRPNRFGKGGVEVVDPARVQPGVTFVTGLFGQRLGARLYGADGELIHEWPVNFFTIALDELAYPFDALIHGDIMFENGDFVATSMAVALFAFRPVAISSGRTGIRAIIPLIWMTMEIYGPRSTWIPTGMNRSRVRRSGSTRSPDSIPPPGKKRR